MFQKVCKKRVRLGPPARSPNNQLEIEMTLKQNEKSSGENSNHYTPSLSFPSIKPIIKPPEFYDLGGIKYKNYKYPKVQARLEFEFLNSLPLDYQGKTIARLFKQNPNVQMTEDALRNIQKRQEINSLSLYQNKSLPLLQKIKQKLTMDAIFQQDKYYPYQYREKIHKKVTKLCDKVQKMNGQSTQNKWIPPVIKYNEQFLQNNIDKIINSQMLFEGQQQPSQVVHSQHLKEQNIAYKKLKEEQILEDEYNNGPIINILNVNKGFQGKGKKMKCLLQMEDKNPIKNKCFGDVIKTINRKNQMFLIVDEYNRLINIDMQQQAFERTRKIQTKLVQKEDIAQSKQKFSSEKGISKTTFMQENQYFKLYLRNQVEIVERIIYGLSGVNAILNFDSLYNFYRIFILENTDRNVFIKFLCKFFFYTQNNINIEFTSMELFLKSLKIISNHPIEGDIYYSKWEESLKNYKEIEFNLHTILRIKHLKLIFNNCIINPDLILKLLYK